MAEQAGLTFEKGPHTYALDGVPVPSVSRVLAPIVEPFYGSFDSPVMQLARLRGTYVHEACQFEDENDLAIGSVDPIIEGYITAWRKFKAENAVTVLLNESKVAHRAMGYAGTLDRVILMKGALWVIDLKTAHQMIQPYDVQTAAYLAGLVSWGMPEGSEWMPTLSTRRGIVLLRPNGTFKLEHCRNTMQEDFSEFMALLRTYKWKEKHCPKS